MITTYKSWDDPPSRVPVPGPKKNQELPAWACSGGEARDFSSAKTWIGWSLWKSPIFTVWWLFFEANLSSHRVFWARNLVLNSNFLDLKHQKRDIIAGAQQGLRSISSTTAEICAESFSMDVLDLQRFGDCQQEGHTCVCVCACVYIL